MKKAFLTIAAICVAVAVCAQGEVLKLNMKQGEVFNQRMETTSSISQNIMGQQMDITNIMQGELHYEVVAVEEGNFVIDVCYTKLTMSMSSPAAAQMNVSGSSDTPDAGDMFSPMLAAMANKTFRITMTPTGRILNITGLEKMYEEFAELETFKSLPPEVVKQMTDQVEKSYGGSLKSNMEMGAAMFPDEPVGPGGSWSTESSTDISGMVMNMKTVYTLVEKTADNILVHAETTVDMGDGNLEVREVSVKYNMAGTMSSEMKLDPVTLWTVSSESLMGIKGSISVKHPQMDTEMTIPMDFEIAVTLTNF